MFKGYVWNMDFRRKIKKRGEYTVVWFKKKKKVLKFFYEENYDGGKLL